MRYATTWSGGRLAGTLAVAGGGAPPTLRTGLRGPGLKASGKNYTGFRL